MNFVDATDDVTNEAKPPLDDDVEESQEVSTYSVGQAQVKLVQLVQSILQMHGDDDDVFVPVP